jgi:elongation factor Ts
MHIAATDPRFVGRDEVAQSDLDREKEVFLAQPAMKGKPEAVVEKILTGKMEKFYEEFCLLDQPFIKESSQTISQLIASKVAKLGENISVRRFARFKVGAADWTVAQTKPAGDDASAAEATA